MPSIRVGFSSDLNITGGNTGIGTATPTARLEVSNGIVAERAAGAGGISTFKEYQGFSQTLATLPHEIATEEGVFSSLTGEIKITGETTVSSGSTVEVGKTKTLTATDRFSVPLGDTNDRDNTPEAGTTRFNQDFGTLEFFDGVNWKTVNSYNRGGAAGRAIFAGGYSSTSGAAGSYASLIDYVNVNTRGNAVYFGELTGGTYAANFGFSSETRGLFGGGYKNSTGTSNHTDVEYVTIASTGNGIDFGDMNSTGNWGKSAHASSTRGLAMGGYGTTNAIDYVQIHTTGNFVDFGDLSGSRFGGAGMGSPTRALCVGGGPNFGVVDSITIASLGNGVEWGIIDKGSYYTGGGSNSIRGVFNTNRNLTTHLRSLNITSFGSVQNFGNLMRTYGNHYPGSNGPCTSHSRLLFAGAGNNSSTTNSIEFVNITTAGDAQDFGDLTTERGYMGACSDSHGGLGGF